MAQRKRGRTRANGEGSIYQRKGRDGWFGSLYVPGGRKIVHRATRDEVVRELRKLLKQRDDGQLRGGQAPTLHAFLWHWLDEVIKPKVRYGTYQGYEINVRRHLVGDREHPTEFGKIRLDRLTPSHVQQQLRANREAGLSPKSVHYVLQVLRSALRKAQAWDLVPRNVAGAELVEAPKVEQDEVQPFSLAEADRFLDAIQGDRLEALYTVALSMGLRQGEALGLRWQDVDLEAAELRVEWQLQRVNRTLILVPLKTKKSRRTLAMPLPVTDALRRHRERQLFEHRAVGDRWTGKPPTDGECFVFTTGTGTPLEARNVIRAFHGLLGKAELRQIRFHDLRHSAATLLLAQGVQDRVVMEVLGWSQTAMLARYQHVLPEFHREVAARMADMLWGARRGRLASADA